MYDEITTSDLIAVAREKSHPKDNPSAEHADLIDELVDRLARLSVWREKMVAADRGSLHALFDFLFYDNRKN